MVAPSRLDDRHRHPKSDSRDTPPRKIPPLENPLPRMPAKRPYDSGTYRRNRKIILEGNPLCALCGERPATTVDHIIPISRGGTNNLPNLRPACTTCNSRRGNRKRLTYRAKW